MKQILDQDLKASRIAAPAIGEERGGYIPLPLRNLTAGDKITFDIYLKVKNRGEQEPKFVLACPRDEVFKEEWYQKLKSLDIQWLYYSQENEAKVLDYLDRSLEKVLPDETRQPEEKVTLLYDTTLICVRNFFTSEQISAGPQMFRALRLIDSMFDLMKGGVDFQRSILDIRRHDHVLYNHSLNVCFMGLAFVSFLGWDAQKAQNFGLGAMLHDIGLIQLRPELLGKEAPCSACKPTDSHPAVGYKIVSNMPGLRREVRYMALQHHENGDGSGYPAGLKINAIDPWARVLRILDQYENLTSGNAAKKPLSSKEALMEMAGLQEKKLFDMNYFMNFIKFIGKT
ncbi:MAG: HD-GYP domain-containing protein [Thermodesulfobacteriota bacterium]